MLPDVLRLDHYVLFKQREEYDMTAKEFYKSCIHLQFICTYSFPIFILLGKQNKAPEQASEPEDKKNGADSVHSQLCYIGYVFIFIKIRLQAFISNFIFNFFWNWNTHGSWEHHMSVCIYKLTSSIYRHANTTAAQSLELSWGEQGLSELYKSITHISSRLWYQYVYNKHCIIFSSIVLSQMKVEILTNLSCPTFLS